MKKSILVNEKKSRGRPKREDGVDPLVAARLPRETVDQLDAWASERGTSRSGAVRMLVEEGLAGATASRAKKSATSSKSSELAGKQLDKMIDPALPAEERETRKRRLLKGPSEFRDVRKDRKKKS